MDIFALLRDCFPDLCLEQDFSFARHTTIGCGGRAAVCASPASEEELAALLAWLAKRSIPYCFLGAGANVLPRDGDFDGVVVRFSRMNSLEEADGMIAAGAGVTGGALLRFAGAHRLGGLEFLTGIPTTVGGAVTMNAGVASGHLGDIVERVVGVEKGKLRVFSRAECRFSEKTSVFQEGIAVAKAYLRTEPSDEEAIRARMACFREKRKHLPKGRSMGCVFVNPEGRSAGAVIDSCGLKGLSVGGARVSEIHANFILNEGGTAEDISILIATVKKRVFERTGILLREEVRRIP